EIEDLEAACPAAFRYLPSSAFMLAAASLTTLKKMKDSDGRPIAWQADASGKSQAGLLLGRPIVVNDDMPTMATGNTSIVYGDLSSYLIRDAGAPLLF